MSWGLSEKHNIGTKRVAFAYWARSIAFQPTVPWTLPTALHAESGIELAVHVDYTLRPSTFVQVVHVLRHQQELTLASFLPMPFKLRQGIVCWVWLGSRVICFSFVVESADCIWIAFESIRGAHIFNTVTIPKTVITCKCCKPAFGRYACARQYDYIHPALMADTPSLRNKLVQTREYLHIAITRRRLEWLNVGKVK